MKPRLRNRFKYLTSFRLSVGFALGRFEAKRKAKAITKDFFGLLSEIYN